MLRTRVKPRSKPPAAREVEDAPASNPWSSFHCNQNMDLTDQIWAALAGSWTTYKLDNRWCNAASSEATVAPHIHLRPIFRLKVGGTWCSSRGTIARDSWPSDLFLKSEIMQRGALTASIGINWHRLSSPSANKQRGLLNHVRMET